MAKENSESSSSEVPHDEVWRQSAWRSSIRRNLLAWFGREARQLPWRSKPTPYRVWVSEIMLQQTQVATVLPYYARFLKAFPSVKALAAADEQDLLNHWEGLGYYRRARSMHAAAKKIVAEHGGKFPETFDEVLDLPGIGRYTAGAVLSISRDQRLPILEGNTQRVFSRWISMRSPPMDSQPNRLLWEIAETMLPRKEPGNFNQAAMELGALICTPKNPNCNQCPVRRHCCAHRDGLEQEIPGKVSRTKYEDRLEFAMVIARSRGKQAYLLRPMPEGGRWAGLWDFPRTTKAAVPSAEAAASELSHSVGATISPGLRLTTIRHAVTKYRISLDVHFATIENGRTKSPWKYVSLEEMEELPMSVSGRKIATLLAENNQSTLPL